MKVTIEPPKERTVTIQMPEGQAYCLMSYLSGVVHQRDAWGGTDARNLYAQLAEILKDTKRYT